MKNNPALKLISDRKDTQPLKEEEPKKVLRRDVKKVQSLRAKMQESETKIKVDITVKKDARPLKVNSDLLDLNDDSVPNTTEIIIKEDTQEDNETI